MNRCYVLCGLLALASMTSRLAAQDQPYTLEVSFEKKVLHVDQLGLPGSFSAAGLLSMLPELLQRPGQTLSNYEIKLEGMPLGDASDATLIQIHLEDVEKIELDESPISAYLNNGQGGSINFVLRSKPSDDQKRSWGKASMDAQYQTDLTPNLRFNYKNGKWLVRNIAIGEYYDPRQSREYNTTGNKQTTKSTNQRFWSELARSYIQYTPTAKDALEIDLSETVSRNSLHTDDNSTLSSNFNKNVSLQAIAKYRHTYNDHANFNIEMQYMYTPNSDGIDNDTQHIYNHRYSHSLSGKAEFTCNLLPRRSKYFLEWNAGLNTNQNFIDEDLKDYQIDYAYNFNYDTNARINYLMPFMTFTGDFGKFKFKTTAEYQYYEYNVRQSDYKRQTLSHNDFTCRAILSWQMKAHQHVRFIFDRKLQRPTNDQIYPYLRFSSTENRFIKGSMEIYPTLMDEISLDYISDYHWGDHNLTINAGVGYNYINDIVCVDERQDNIDTQSVTDFELPYVTYKNSGTNHLTIGRLMALYNYRIFSLSFSGNVANNRKKLENGKDYYTFYNLSILPSLNFRNGLTTAFNLVYISKVKTVSSELGQCTYGLLSVGKNWTNLSLYLYGRAPFTGKTKDTTDDTTREYHLVNNAIGVGFSYRF